jgi:uncharacterized protein (DUF58 family)
MAHGTGGERPDTDSAWKVLNEAIGLYAEGVAAAQQEAQKQMRSAYLSYLEQLRASLEQPPVHDAVRAYGELVKAGMTTPTEVQAIADGARNYSKAVHDAQGAIGTKVRDAGTTLSEEVQKASARATAAQRKELEKLVKKLQAGLSGFNAEHADPVALAVMGQAVTMAAMLHAHSM